MARLLRIESAGAIYHVTARGNAREAMFHEDADRELFLGALGEPVARFGWLEEKAALKEIPRAQRLANRPHQKPCLSRRCARTSARDAAVRRACLEYSYTMRAVAQAAGAHYSTVSKVIKGER